MEFDVRFCVDTSRKGDNSMAQGIWSQMLTKFSIILWRIRCEYLTTFSKLIRWGIQIQSICLLCNKEEAIGHQYFYCEYTREFLIKMIETVGQSIWKISNTPLPTPNIDIGIEDLTTGDEN